MEIWTIIKRLLNKKSKKSYYPLEFLNNGSTISGNKKITEYFNEFFVNIDPPLARNVPKCNTNFEYFLGGSRPGAEVLGTLALESIFEVLVLI